MTAKLLIAMIITAFVLFLMMLATVRAFSAECLTYHEARAKWRKAHLVWHGSRHCWDNGRHRLNDTHPRRHHDEGDPAVHIVEEREFNLLDAQAGSQATWPRAFGPWQDRVGGSFK